MVGVWVGVGVTVGSGSSVAVGVNVGGTGEFVKVTVIVGVRKGVNVRDGVKEGVGVSVIVTVPVGGKRVSVGGADVAVIVEVKVTVGVRVGWLSQASTWSMPKPRQ